VFGHNAVAAIDWAGVVFFFGTLAGVFVHGGLRVLAARRSASHEATLQRVYMYGVYERFWHWLQTAVILGLLFTGVVIHKPDMFGALSFSVVVDVHNVLAALLVINAALALFYHLTSGEIRQFLPKPHGFFSDAIEQALYYLRGIFRGETHPFDKRRDRKMNPLQQMTYLAILNVLLPAQIITGALMWGAKYLPDTAQALGGLPLLAPAHTLVAWLFASFIVAHVYLTTTGHKPLSNIKAMIQGWDDIEAPQPAATGD
jgi:thiosulfate reductase cytochrome b subunit